MTRGRFLLLTILLCSVSAIGTASFRGMAFIDGDGPYYRHTCESLRLDGDLNLLNQLTGHAAMSEDARLALAPHQGFFALSPDGVIVPKHSVLLPVLAIPFAAVFGIYGYLAINVLLMVALVALTARLGGDTPAARWMALFTLLTSCWFGYCFNYSNDVFCAVAITGSYAAARDGNGFWCGVFAGCAVWAKVYAGVILLPLAIVVVPQGVYAIRNTISGAALVLGPMLLLNQHLYGGPFVTGYDRDAWLTADGFRVREHYSLFNQPLIPGLLNVLFDLQAGMLRTWPLWFLIPLGFWRTWQSSLRDQRRFAVAMALGSISNVLLFAPYECWNATWDGNRFLLPAVALAAPLLTTLMDWLLNVDYFVTVGEHQSLPCKSLSAEPG